MNETWKVSAPRVAGTFGDKKCRKCGSVNFFLEWNMVDIAGVVRERLRCTCVGCGHVSSEIPLDAENLA